MIKLIFKGRETNSFIDNRQSETLESQTGFLSHNCAIWRHLAQDSDCKSRSAHRPCDQLTFVFRGAQITLLNPALDLQAPLLLQLYFALS